MQVCDSTCQHCARQFWRFLKFRIKSDERESAREGHELFFSAAATSVRPEK